MTDAEHRLWLKLCRKQLSGLQFYRQRIIGNFIVDFYCPRAGLVIEVDGGQHYHGKVKANDKIRDESLKNLGLKVLRFSDGDVLKEIDGVLEEIHRNLNPPFIYFDSVLHRYWCSVEKTRRGVQFLTRSELFPFS